MTRQNPSSDLVTGELPAMTTRTSSARPLRTVLLAAVALTLGLGGCASRRTVEPQAEIPDLYTERHPIVLGDVGKSLDVFLAPNAGLDHRQKQELAEFLKKYRQDGKGALVMTLPPAAPAGAVQHTVSEIRAVASSAGVSSGQFRSISGPTHPTAASVRLTYSALDAKVVSKCGQWPHDFTGGSTTQSWANKPYYNLGCSYQTMMTSQVANPVDHVRSRPDEAGDIGKRLHDIKSIREGKDPSTKWQTENDKISKSM